MRIISGKHKGKRILAPKNLPVRPTTDRAKEALFNILNNNFYFEDLSIIDLFAGTGNISYEFASRGCNQIICVDNNYNCLKFIQKMATALHFNIKIIKNDAFTFLKNTKLQANIVFADPPYHFTLDNFSELINLIFKNRVVEENGWFIIEHSSYNNLDTLPYFSSSKKYGNNSFSFFNKPSV